MGGGSEANACKLSKSDNEEMVAPNYRFTGRRTHQKAHQMCSCTTQNNGA